METATAKRPAGPPDGQSVTPNQMDFQMSSYCAETLHLLLRQLQSEQAEDRIIADMLLGNILMAIENRQPMRELVCEALNHFGAERAEFLRSLFVWRVDSVAQAYEHTNSPRQGASVVQRWRLEQATALTTDSPILRFPMMFGHGIGLVFGLLDEELLPMLDLLRAGLSHPDWRVSSCVLEALARLGKEIESVLAFLYAHGNEYGNFKKNELLVGLCQRHPETITLLVADLAEARADQRVELACQVFTAGKADGAWLDAVLEKLDAKPSAADQYFLFACACSLAVRLNDLRAETLSAGAMVLFNAKTAYERGAAAHAFAHFGEQKSLIQCLTDSDWEVRDYAADAASFVRSPMPELVCAVANLLGDYEGCDGLPHDRAMTTLISFGATALAAQAQIERFIASNDDDNATTRSIMSLIESIGTQAIVLKQCVHDYWKARQTDFLAQQEVIDADEFEGAAGGFASHNLTEESFMASDSAPGNTGNTHLDELLNSMHDQANFDAKIREKCNQLAAFLHLDMEEEIPGLTATREYPPEPIDQLKIWLHLVS